MRAIKSFLQRSSVLAVAGLTALSGCSPKPHPYRIALRHLPTDANPFTSQINTDLLVMLQIYYPLFTRLSSGALTSEFLERETTHAIDSEFKRYDLCLKPGIKYSDGSPILPSDLERTLRESHKRQESLPALESILIHGQCASVTLAATDLHYFDKLTDISNTVVAAHRQVFGFPVGLGPYQVAESSPTRIQLIANPGRVRGDLKLLEFIKFTNVEDDFKAGVVDFNHTGQIEIPEHLRAQLKRVSRATFKSYALVLNYPNGDLRRNFARCLDRLSFSKLLDMPLTETPGFLPLGIFGSSLKSEEPEKPMSVEAASPASPTFDQSCRTRDVAPMTLINYRAEINENFGDFLRSNQKRLPIPIELKLVSVDELVKAMFSKDRIAAVIGFDSANSGASASQEAATFFESFMRKNRSERLITSPVPGLEEAVRSALAESGPETKDSKYRIAHRILLESGYVVPLGQLEMDQYYPKYLTGISWSDRISGFPRFDLMQIQ